jgi:hypothetical protein
MSIAAENLPLPRRNVSRKKLPRRCRTAMVSKKTLPRRHRHSGSGAAAAVAAAAPPWTSLFPTHVLVKQDKSYQSSEMQINWYAPTENAKLWKILKNFCKNHFFIVAECRFLLFRELYLRKHKSKMAEILGADTTELALSSIKFSLILVGLRKTYFRNNDRDEISLFLRISCSH